MQIKDSPVIKKLLAALPFAAAAVLAIAAFLVTNRHVSETKDNYKEYVSAMAELQGYLTEVIKADNKSKTVSSRRGSAMQEIENARKAAEYFEDLKTPKCLRDDHEELMKSISKEHEFIRAAENVFKASSDEQIEKALSGLSEFGAYQSSSGGFPVSLAKFIAAVDREQEHARKSKRSVFVWI